MQQVLQLSESMQEGMHGLKQQNSEGHSVLLEDILVAFQSIRRALPITGVVDESEELELLTNEVEQGLLLVARQVVQENTSESIADLIPNAAKWHQEMERVFHPYSLN